MKRTCFPPNNTENDIELSVLADPLRNLKNEIQFLKATHQQILDSYIAYEPLHIRGKRSLLPLFSFFSFVFGTAKDSNVSALRHSVSKLANTQRSIIYVLESNLSILNITRHDISQNRQAINTIINALGEVETKLKLLNGKIETEIDHLRQ